MAGLCDWVADGDLIKLPEELLFLDPELSFLELGQQLRLLSWLYLVPPFTSFSPEALPTTPAPGVVNPQQEDTLASPTPELLQI